MGTTRITYQGACVLQALSRGLSYGFDIMELTGLASGSVYPILRRFEEHGLVESEWEDTEQAHAVGRPRRRHYRLTGTGHAELAAAADRLALHRKIFLDDQAAGEATP
ncbi:MAG: PadR family transcriptional regulator [Gemmatimonadota bacterium]|jgi:DNA-binding PadR family transcriptional regulator